MIESKIENKRNFKNWLPGVIISAVAIFILVRLAKWEDLTLAFAAIKPFNLILGVLITLLWLLVRAFALRILLDKKVTICEAFKAINIGYLLNNLFPLRAGEFGKALILGNDSGLGMLHVLSTIVIERAFDLVFAAGLILSTLPLALGMDWAKPVAYGTLILVVLGLVVLFLIARNKETIHKWVDKLSESQDFVKNHISPRMDSIFNGLQPLTQPRLFLLSLFWIGVSWFLGVVLYYEMLLPIAPEAPFWWGVFTDAVLALGIAVPSAPAALGVFEASIVGGLSLLGVSRSAALAYALLMHILQFVVTGILGFIGLAQEKKSLGNLFEEIRLKRISEK
ncbi:MAG: flippase-like domain-containing protein [Anaerolineaceae bacterium]|nr:flippase-like domain-containing protein [Anaerolineaceae bacterium]